MLPTRSTWTVQPTSVHQVMKRSRISLSASVRASRQSPPALPGPISPERMTVLQKRRPSMPESVFLMAMAHAPFRGVLPPQPSGGREKGRHAQAPDHGEDRASLGGYANPRPIV